MSKSKNKKGGLPKKIGGVKLPKEARRQAERAIAELKQPIVREMIVGAVGMAVSTLARQAADWKAAKPATPPSLTRPADAKTDTKPAIKSNGEQLAEIATGLAVAGLRRFFEKMQAAGDPAGNPKSPKI